ncbi:MAG: methionine--tRNA ligase [Bacteroidales bacterium]|nr:methionine--tRNA ligase [Bacteroidales bacterium]
MEKKWKRYLVTTALPYANGPIHIGHLAGVYVPADIYVRFLRKTGEDVLFIGGSDEHGVPITIRAMQEGKTPQEVVDFYHDLICKSFEEFGISFDIYSRTSLPIHHETSSSFFKKLYEEGKLIEIETEQYYDEEASMFLADRYIRGTCPKCGYESAYGDQCEKCGSSLSPEELLNPTSILSNKPPVRKKTKHWYLPLDKYEEWLRHWILEEHQEWKPNVYGQCKSWLDAGLKPRAVTRDLTWGVKVPIEGYENKVLYVWFDAPIGYISATKHWSHLTGKSWEPYWKDNDTRLIHFIGKDNIVFHCIIFPAMLKAHGEFILPDNVPANEFLNLENDKISTSRNWAVWLHEYLQDFPGLQDALRYMLTIVSPETKDNNFSWKEFQTHVNGELVDVYSNFVHRTLSLIHSYYDGIAPAQNKPQELEKLLQEVRIIKENIFQALHEFRFRDAMYQFIQIARLGNKYLTDKEPWKLQKADAKEAEGILFNALQLVANLYVLSEIFLPFSAQKLQHMLRIDSLSWDKVGSILIPPGHQLNKPQKLFERITDEMVEKQTQKLKKDKSSSSISQIKPTINIEDFEKLDLRVVRVLHAEKIEKSDKLLKLEVDLGFEKRFVVSGVAPSIHPSELIGKKVVLLANLKKKNIRNVESHGMILYALHEDGTYGLVEVTSEKSTPGNSIS